MVVPSSGEFIWRSRSGAFLVRVCLNVLLLGQGQCEEQSSTEAQFVSHCLVQHDFSSGAFLLKTSMKSQ